MGYESGLVSQYVIYVDARFLAGQNLRLVGKGRAIRLDYPTNYQGPILAFTHWNDFPLEAEQSG
jgi:hypothetical protein